MEDIFAALNKITSETDITKLSLRNAVIASAKVKEAMAIVKKAVSASKPQDSELAYKEALRLTLKQAPSIYAGAVADAVGKADEYAYDQFLSPLLDVGFDEDLYEIIPMGTGWGRSIIVHLKMNEIAGDIGDYAQAIDATRDALNIKEGRDPERASKIWRTKIYKGPRYFTTIRTRLSNTSQPAPFWSLLNDGSKNVTMSSDIGGTPYPSRGGHHFVANAESEIKSFFIKTFFKFRDTTNKNDPTFKEAIAEADRLLIELQSLIDRLSTESELMLGIARAIGVNVDKLTASKIIIAAERIKSGDIFTSQVVVGEDKRIRTATFIRLVNQFGGY